jgi:hypothetical protein
MLRIRGKLLWLFAGLGVLGALVAALGGLGGIMVLGATGAIWGALEKRGLEADEALVGELYQAVLIMDRPWGWVLIAGGVVILLALWGFVAVWRAQ